MLHTLKNACHFFIQSGVKQTPIVIGLRMLTCITCSYRYLSRVLIGSLVVMTLATTLNSKWLEYLTNKLFY